MLELQCGFPRPRQQTRCLEHVLDLSPVELRLAQFVQLFLAESVRVGGAIQELAPDMASGGCIEIFVGQRDMDSGFEGWIDIFGSVGGEKENTL